MWFLIVIWFKGHIRINGQDYQSDWLYNVFKTLEPENKLGLLESGADARALKSSETDTIT